MLGLHLVMDEQIIRTPLNNVNRFERGSASLRILLEKL